MKYNCCVISALVQLFLTYFLLGWPVFAGVLVLVILLPLDAFIARWVGKLAKRVLRVKDTRSKIMAGVVSGIRLIKFYGWEYPFRDMILRIRKEEYKRLRSYSLLIAFQQFFSATIPILTSLATFGLYFLVGGDLSPEKLFTALSLLTSLRNTVRFLAELCTEMVKAFISFKRIALFLQSKELHHLPHLPDQALHPLIKRNEPGDSKREAASPLSPSEDLMDTTFSSQRDMNGINRSGEAISMEKDSNAQNPQIGDSSTRKVDL